MAWEKSMFIGCSHGDLLCDKAAKVAKQFMADWKPKHRVHLGDLYDFRALRRGASPEEKMEGLTHDYQCGNLLLDWYKPQILTLGNHDHRVWRAAGETSNGVMADLLATMASDMEDDFRKRGIQWKQWGVDQYAVLPVGGPKLLHGYRSTVSPAKAHFDAYGDSICAHVHKPDTYHARHIDGQKAYTVGTLARIKDMSYADGYTAKLGWRQSFLYGLHNTKTGAWQAWHVVNEDGQWVSPHGIL
jgi:hypothetical protein